MSLRFFTLFGLFFVISLYCQQTLAAAKSAIHKQHMEHKAKQHARVSIHGMVLFKIDDALFISHLPMHHPMHDQQFIAQIKLNKGDRDKITSLLQQHELVTLMPEVFDLNQLINSEITQFKADVFANHFERGGKRSFEHVQFTVTKRLLARPLLADSEIENGVYYRVAATDKSDLLVHRITKSPSFDQLIVAAKNQYKAPLVDLSNRQKAPLKNDINHRSIYLETQDFN